MSFGPKGNPVIIQGSLIGHTGDGNLREEFRLWDRALELGWDIEWRGRMGDAAAFLKPTCRIWQTGSVWHAQTIEPATQRKIGEPHRYGRSFEGLLKALTTEPSTPHPEDGTRQGRTIIAQFPHCYPLWHLQRFPADGLDGRTCQILLDTLRSELAVCLADIAADTDGRADAVAFWGPQKQIMEEAIESFEARLNELTDELDDAAQRATV